MSGTGSMTSPHTRLFHGSPPTPRRAGDDIVEKVGLSLVDRFVGPPQGVALGAEEERSAVGPEAVRAYPVLLAARTEQLG